MPRHLQTPAEDEEEKVSRYFKCSFVVIHGIRRQRTSMTRKEIGTASRGPRATSTYTCRDPLLGLDSLHPERLLERHELPDGVCRELESEDELLALLSVPPVAVSLALVHRPTCCRMQTTETTSRHRPRRRRKSDKRSGAVTRSMLSTLRALRTLHSTRVVRTRWPRLLTPISPSAYVCAGGKPAGERGVRGARRRKG